MIKAFHISRVFKSFSDTLTLVDQPTVAAPSTTIIESVNDVSTHAEINTCENILISSVSTAAPISGPYSSVSVDSNLHYASLSVESNESVANPHVKTPQSESSIPMLCSFEGNLPEHNSAFQDSSHLNISQSNCFTSPTLGDECRTSHISNNEPIDTALFSSPNLIIPSPDRILGNQIQILMQNWMEISVCNVSELLYSIYKGYLLQNVENCSSQVETPSDVS
ncbi:hypothetical protein LOD99_14218 [Oopsacas minuta]|uniref:Uncharacterized protein n=1 Tax=Oopsacas minuta TaxID=111878 RepID=A0AAV7KF43_9METZ|nr:hypothetical protein LOD99_14218 [Oopsacas minuta]